MALAHVEKHVNGQLVTGVKSSSDKGGRKTSQGRLPSLDGLRAVSIALVLGSHIQVLTPNAVSYFPPLIAFDGALGVRIFFVISGFIITYLFIREEGETGKISISRFYLRRLIRLYPVNLAFVGFLFLLTRLTDLAISRCQFLADLTYTKNLFCGGWIDGHLWSLGVEEQFYLLWPLAFALLPRKGLYCAALAFIAIAPFSRALEYLSGSRLYEFLSSNSDVLMIGCLLALLCSDNGEVVKKAINWRPALGRTLALFLMYVPIALSYRMLWGSLTVTLGPMIQAASAGYLLLSVLFIQEGLAFSFLNSQIVRSLGFISYSLYIWQQPFLLSPPSLFGAAGPWFLAFPQNVMCSIVCAAVSYLALERPLLAIRKRLHLARSPSLQRGTQSV